MVEKAGSRGTIVQADVSDEQQVVRLFAIVKHHFKQVDILVNSAGVRSADKLIHQMSFEEFEKTVRVNLFATFLCCQNFVKHYSQRQGSGRIINITSVHEEIVSPAKTDYCASNRPCAG